MGQNSSKVPQQKPQLPLVQEPAVPVTTPSFGRAQTMLDVSQAQFAAAGDAAPGSGLPRSSSDTALSAQAAACQQSYQQALEWGRNEHFFKLAHTFHTNNY